MLDYQIEYLETGNAKDRLGRIKGEATISQKD